MSLALIVNSATTIIPNSSFVVTYDASNKFISSVKVYNQCNLGCGVNNYTFKITNVKNPESVKPILGQF